MYNFASTYNAKYKNKTNPDSFLFYEIIHVYNMLCIFHTDVLSQSSVCVLDQDDIYDEVKTPSVYGYESLSFMHCDNILYI